MTKEVKLGKDDRLVRVNIKTLAYTFNEILKKREQGVYSMQDFDMILCGMYNIANGIIIDEAFELARKIRNNEV